MGLRASWAGKRLLLILFFSMLCATGCCTQRPWPFRYRYTTQFIDGQGRVIDPQKDGSTTSEGQAYAMFFALVDNDRAVFDRVLAWTQNNLASGDLQTHLPSWLWGKNKDGQWKTIDPNPASDADVWMAYTLIEAGRLWKYPTYTYLGKQMLRQIAKTEVVNLPGFGTMLLPGPAAAFQHDNKWTLNPSYLPLFIFDRLAVVDPAGPWRQIASGIPRLLRESARKGFAMDWVDYVPGDGFSPAPGQQSKDAKDPKDPVGSYDAIRVYLWAGMLNNKEKARAEILSAVPGMGEYLVNHDAPPEKVSEQGIPLEKDGPVGFSAAVLPYLKALPDLRKLIARQTDRLNAQKDSASGLYGKDKAYYDQNLALFGTAYLEGRYQFGPSGELKVEWTR